MKLSTDLSGNYLLVTDIHRRVVYCFEVFSFHDEEDHTKGNCYIRYNALFPPEGSRLNI